MNISLATCSLILALTTSFGAPSLAAAERVSASDERAYSAFSDDPHRQFDFWIGGWDVNLRMMDDDMVFQDRIAAKTNIYSILHGKAILEFWDSQPIKGYSLRYFDPERDEWVLWLNWPGQNRSTVSSLSGAFRHGRGEFRSTVETPDGETILQRYAFSDITPFSLRWDDLLSRDGGQTWSKSWRMEFTRTAVEPDWPLESLYFPTYESGERCSEEAFDVFDAIPGHWHGRINGNKASISSWHVLDGCGVIAFLDIDRPAAKRFFFMTFDTQAERWEIDYLDDDRQSGLLRLVSADAWTTTSDGDNKLQLVPMGDELEYRFEGADGTLESGSFERRELEGH